MFGRRIPLFKVFGFSIGFDLSWILIVVVLTWTLAAGVFPHLVAEVWGEQLPAGAYWAMGVAGALGLFASVVFHELGHALTARRFGVEMRGITLFIFGGVAEMTDEPPSAKAEFWIAIAGPIASVILAVAFWFITFVPMHFAATTVIGYLALINLALVVFNMIPAFPLDGGRVLRAALWHWKQSLSRATRITSTIGSGFGIVLMGLAVLALFQGNFIGAMWYFLIGLFIRHAAQMGYQQVLIREALEGETVARFMNRDVQTVPTATPIDRFVDDYVYRHHYKFFPVVRNGELVGCASTSALRGMPREQWAEHTIDEIVDPCGEENTIGPDTDAVDAMRRMSMTGRSRLLVAEGGRLVGIIALKDLLRFLSLKLELEQGVEQRGPEV